MAASARFVLATLDDAVRDVGGPYELLAGWDPSRAGEPFEAHDVPTRAGRLSYGIRWHGERPALLWEVTPWPDRVLPDGATAPPFVLTAPAIDPAWTGGQLVGEALLAVPVGVEPPAPDPASDPAPDGGSFS